MTILRARVHVQSTLLSLAFVLLPLPFCLSRDTITTLDNPISDQANETLVSANGLFRLGFFTPSGSSDSRRYVGIWYNGNHPLTVVWVANRDNPLSNNTGFFGLAKDGKIAVWNSSHNPIWSSKLEGEASLNRTIRLMDTGNLVLSGVEGSRVLWQSFDNPTDTFLPGMIWSKKFNLTSWNSFDDPKGGSFTFWVDTGNQYNIHKQGTRLPYCYWNSGVYSKLQGTDETISIISCLLNSSCSLSNESDVPWQTKDTSKVKILHNVEFFNHTRLVMNWTGQIQFYRRHDASAQGPLSWYHPGDVCDIVNYCGNYGSCNSKNSVPCKCLPGFEPMAPEKWSSGEFSAGCRRKSSDICQTEFVGFNRMKAGSPQENETASEEKCKNICLKSCDCQAYYYRSTSFSQRGHGSPTTCWTWSGDLNNILEQTKDDYNLQVRMTSNTDPIKKSCKFCGTNVIPYPLSTGESCGDLLYNKFTCDNSISQLSFGTSNVSYRVTRVTPESRKFAISLGDNTTSCPSMDLLNERLQLDDSSKFHIIGGCNSSRNINPGAFSQDQGLYEIEIGWSMPPPPQCKSDIDCYSWLGTTCNGTSGTEKVCHCHTNSSWNPLNANCTSAKTSKQFGRPSADKKYFYLLSLAAIVILIVGFFYCRRRPKHENEGSTRENPAFHLYDCEQRIKQWISSDRFQEEDKKGIDVPFFELEIILAATNNFSTENKLGQGGFGPVYKGTFPGGQKIAIKRLSHASGQGLEEFKNEVVLIAKLQHRNLVRLLGYCIEGEEKILLYEYMPNGSLDSFIFDRTRCLLLTWERRFEIILGIARGMLYLHQDSRLRIIHRDMKPSNVLLDEEMNPKISDFGLARIFESKQTEATTRRVIGTYGYMSPEYALDGFFSFKSDVFSFGVVVLEIISGKRNTAFYQSMGKLNLITHAWKFWSEDNALNMVDHALSEACNTSEVLKCINVALLCVQEDPIDRPTMSNILFMLGSENASLPAPKRPGFAVNRSFSTESSSSKPETIYEMSTTIVQGR